MKILKGFRISTAALVCLCGALTLGLARGFTEAPGDKTDSAIPVQKADWSSRFQHEIFDGPEKGGYAQITTLPLFNVTRRPVPKVVKKNPVTAKAAIPNDRVVQEVRPKLQRPSPPPKPSAPSLTGLRLLGVLLNEDLRQAVVQVNGSSEGIAVTENTSLLGWTVLQIGIDHIVLAHDLERRTFRLYDPNHKQLKEEKIKYFKLEPGVEQPRSGHGKVRLRVVQ